MRKCERGEGRVGFVLTLGAFVIAVFLAVKIVPARVDGYQFKEVLREEARHAAVHRNDSVVLERILAAAESMDIPLAKENLKLDRSKVSLTISASYEKPIDLTVGTYTYKFHSQQSAPLF